MFAFCSIFKSRSATHPARLWNRTSPRPAPKSKPQFFRGVLEAGRVGERCNAFQRSHWVCAPSVAPPPRRIFPATGQGLERTAQAVQGQAINASHGACLIVWVARNAQGLPFGVFAGAGKHPLIAARQGVHQVRDIRGQRNHSFTLYLVGDGQPVPLGVYVVPAQAQHLPGPRASQQQGLKVGDGHRVRYVWNCGEPCGQLAHLFDASLSQRLPRLFGLG